MKKEIKIPDIAENVESGVIGNILVSKGDKVKKDQSLVEVETDKAATDIPSPYDGTIDEIKIKEGDDVSVDQVIMIIEVSDASGSDEDNQTEDDQQKSSDEDETTDEDDTGDTDEEDDEDSSESDPSEEKTDGKTSDSDSTDEEEKEEDDEADRAKDQKDTDKRGSKGEDIPAAPSVRRMAREAGIDLAKVEGSGPGNRITSEDIDSIKKKKGSDKEEKQKAGGKDSDKQSKGTSVSKESAIELPDFSQWGSTKKEKLNTIRRITGRTMTASWQQIPQVTQFDEAFITDIEKFRQNHKEEYEKKGGKLTITAILLKVIAYALQKYPRFNSSIDTTDNTLIMKQYINIGIAVDTDKGLIVPVIKNIDKKSLEDISIETVELAKKARENKISPDELQGGNFTISNLGGIGGTGFTPIVYPPQVAILGVSKAAYKQVYKDERFQQQLVMPLTLTYDHRVIDGADGARFLRWVCEVLEDPYALLK